jgi:multidrug resistance protein, MATE family
LKPGSLRHSAARIAPLAWPVFVGQVSVLAFATVDTLLVARYSAIDLAALAIGAAAYLTVFIGFMGVVLAISPIVGQLHGGGHYAQAGRQFHQALWVALGLSLIGSAVLAFPHPFLSLSQASPEVAQRVRGYLLALALALPASLLFTVFRGFNVAVSRPKVVMALQLGGLALKIPLSSALVWGVPLIGLPALGVVGCGVATCIAMWAQALAAGWVIRRDAFYAPYGIAGRGLDAPDRIALGAHLKLGVPMGLSILIEVTSFTFMAIFIARLGTTPVAGHQIAANLTALLFMMPLAIGNATSTLVAQRIGARDAHDAQRLGWHGVQIGIGVATLMSLAVLAGREPLLALYTRDAAVLAAALPLLGWLALFHVADAVQAIAAFVLRAYRVARAPMLILAFALWFVGLGGGYLLAFDVLGGTPASLQGAPGFWIAASAGLTLAALSLCGFLAWMQRRPHARRSSATSQQP